MAQVMTNVNNYIYELDNKVYVNLTNACTNACLFCIRSQKDDVKGTNMWLTQRPDLESVIEQLENKKNILIKGVTFCGYGEPLLEADLVIKVAKHIKEHYPDVKIKINTNGLAETALKRDIISDLKDYVDEISISLNAQNEELYNKMCQPKINNAYNEMLSFAKRCTKNNIKTTMTVVTHYKDFNIDINKCKEISQNIGADFRERPWLENGY